MAASIAALVVVFVGPRAWAHPLDPVLLELREQGGGVVDVTWKAPLTKIPGGDISPVLPSSCTATSEPVVENEDDAFTARWSLHCEGAGLAGTEVGVTGLENTDALVRVELAGGGVERRVLGAGRPTLRISAAPSPWSVLADYGRLGVVHILGGVDHLVFVFGLLLLVPPGRTLLATITAFTIGHSVTLALAALQIVSIPQAPVEVVIAATIYLLAVELARPQGAASTLLRRRPWAMACAFGLLHGLGFAGALRETGLPAGDIPLALLSFNLGIEAGQIVFVAAVLALGALGAGPIARLSQGARLAPVYAMGAAAVYWILERSTLLL